MAKPNCRIGVKWTTILFGVAKLIDDIRITVSFQRYLLVYLVLNVFIYVKRSLIFCVCETNHKMFKLSDANLDTNARKALVAHVNNTNCPKTTLREYLRNTVTQCHGLELKWICHECLFYVSSLERGSLLYTIGTAPAARILDHCLALITLKANIKSETRAVRTQLINRLDL